MHATVHIYIYVHVDLAEYDNKGLRFPMWNWNGIFFAGCFFSLYHFSDLFKGKHPPGANESLAPKDDHDVYSILETIC